MTTDILHQHLDAVLDKIEERQAPRDPLHDASKDMLVRMIRLLEESIDVVAGGRTVEINDNPSPNGRSWPGDEWAEYQVPEDVALDAAAALIEAHRDEYETICREKMG